MFLCKYVLIVVEHIVLMVMYIHQHMYTIQLQVTQLTNGLPADVRNM
jgi:hypothetical protein